MPSPPVSHLADDLFINSSVGCHYFMPGPRLLVSYKLYYLTCLKHSLRVSILVVNGPAVWLTIRNIDTHTDGAKYIIDRTTLCSTGSDKAYVKSSHQVSCFCS